MVLLYTGTLHIQWNLSNLTPLYSNILSNPTIIRGTVTKLKYGKRHSIIQKPPNPTLFSGPIECQIREVSLYTAYCKPRIPGVYPVCRLKHGLIYCIHTNGCQPSVLLAVCMSGFLLWGSSFGSGRDLTLLRTSGFTLLTSSKMIWAKSRIVCSSGLPCEKRVWEHGYVCRVLADRSILQPQHTVEPLY